MQKRKNVLTALLCGILLFLMLLPSCTERVTEEPFPEPSVSEDASTVTYKYVMEPELISYEQVWEARWWNRSSYYDNVVYGTDFSYYVEEQVPWTANMPWGIKPNSMVIEITKRPYSCIHASLDASRFLSEKNTTRKEFILVSVVTAWYGYDSIEERNEQLRQWCVENSIDGEIIGNTGHIWWNGNAKELDEINAKLNENGYFNVALVCLVNEFEELYGVTADQAEILIEKGFLDMWCLPTIEDSPLYKMFPTEIAAYLAEHPELLEE